MNLWKNNVVLCTNASDLAIGAILMQDRQMVAYESRKLNSVELNYPIYERELFAMIHAFKVCRHYLLGVKFRIEIDHKSLKYLSTQCNLNRR